METFKLDFFDVCIEGDRWITQKIPSEAISLRPVAKLIRHSPFPLPRGQELTTEMWIYEIPKRGFVILHRSSDFKEDLCPIYNELDKW